MRVTGIISPRAPGRVYEDIGDRPGPIARQRVRRRSTSRTRRAKRVLRVGLVVALGVAASGAGIAFALSARPFAIAAIDVRGASRLSEAQIREAAGIVLGVNLFRFDPTAAGRRLQRLPEIRYAEVVRSLPNRVTITVEERRPFTLVHAGKLHWIDEEGTPIGLVRLAVAPQAPVISGLRPEELEAMREHPSPKAQSAIALIRALLRAGSPLTAQISEIDVSRADELLLYTVDGVEVRLGADSWEHRLPQLESVLRELASTPEPIVSIDLRFRDQVVLNGAGAR